MAILDSLPEQSYDDVARLASALLRTPLAMVSFVARDTQWWKAAIGTGERGTPRAAAFCAHAILTPDEVFVVPDATQDPRFHDNPLVTGEPGVRFYAGAPIVTPRGEALGAMCVLDRVPRTLTAEETEQLRALARLVVALLEARRTTGQLEARLLAQADFLKHLTNLTQMPGALPAGRIVAAGSAADPLGDGRAFQQRLHEAHALARRNRTPLSLLMIGIDGYEARAAADAPAALADAATVGDLLARVARVSDPVFRYGASDFAILLPDTELDGATVLAGRFQRTVAEHAWPGRPATVSWGAAALGPRVQLKGDLTVAALRALQRARAKGPNQGHAHQPAERAHDYEGLIGYE